MSGAVGTYPQLERFFWLQTYAWRESKFRGIPSPAARGGGPAGGFGRGYSRRASRGHDTPAKKENKHGLAVNPMAVVLLAITFAPQPAHIRECLHGESTHQGICPYLCRHAPAVAQLW